MNETGQPTPKKSSPFIFIIVFLMLCALTGLSFWIGRSHLMEDKFTGWSAMMAVSVAKAMLVVLFFMHLWWERPWKYVLTLPAIIMGALLVLLLVPDIGFRTERYSQERNSSAAESRELTLDSVNSEDVHFER